jgi:hypothetical protein
MAGHGSGGEARELNVVGGPADDSADHAADAGGIGRVGDGSVAEEPVAVVAPAVRIAILVDGTRVCVPALIWRAVKPLTRTGVGLDVVVPLPSWPFTLDPQHRTLLSTRSEHGGSGPADRLHRDLPADRNGGQAVGGRSVAELPVALYPNADTVPSARTRYVASVPHVTLFTAPPSTCGVVAFVVVPLPSWP